MIRSVKYFTVGLIAACMTMLAASCGSSRKVAVTEPATQGKEAVYTPEQIFEQVIAGYQPEWTRLRLPINASVSSPIAVSGSGYLTMERGKSLSLSIRVLGMEVALLYVDNESVMVIDRWNKQYICENISQFMGGFNLDINNLQDLILGRLFVVGESFISVKDKSLFEFATDGDVWACRPVSANDKYNLGFAFRGKSLFTLMVQVAKGESQVVYAEPVTTSFGTMASGLDFVTRVAAKPIALQLQYNFGKAKWGDDVNSPIVSAPKNYARKELNSLIKDLKF